MTTSSASGASALLTEITDAELAVVGPTLEGFLTTLQSPTVNYLTVLQAAKNLQLQILTLDGPAQAVFINLIASALLAKLKSILTPPAAA